MGAAPRSVPRWNVPLVVAGAIVAFGGFAASAWIGRASEPVAKSQPTTSIVVAARDLEQRRTLAGGDLRLSQYTKVDVPPGALTDVKAAAGMVLQVNLKSGQPLLTNLLAKTSGRASSQASFLPLPSGYVADTLPTTELAGVAGNIRPGDYIDVQAIVTPRTGGRSNIRTVYAGVHVISVGLASDQPNATGSATAAGSLTVAVTECQAEFLNWFLANATLKYTLLSSEDYSAAAAAPPDPTCPASGSKGVTEADIKSHWPGLDGP